MATTAWSWTRTWSRYKCTSRREREQMIRTLRTGRPSERFALMLMVLYWFVCGVFLSLFSLMTSVKSEWSKTDKINKSLSERACAVEVCFTSRLWWWFCFACVHQSEQHRWLLHSPALMITRGVSIACVQLSTGRDACCIVTTHLCRLPLVWTSHTFDAGTATHTSSFVPFKSVDTWPTCTSLLCAWEAFGSASPKSARSVISDTRSNLCGWLNFYFPRISIVWWSDCLFRDATVLT